MKLLPAIFAGFLILVGCSDRSVPPIDGPRSIRFELVYPQPPSSDAYFGVSGVRLVTDDVAQDTIVRVTGRSFFAQFYTGGPELPTSVELNGIPFVRHLETDTLRLGTSSSTSFFGVQSWRLTDAQGPTSFQVNPLQEIDSVLPVMWGDLIRGDTSLLLTWRSPSTATGGVLITWRMQGVETWSQTFSDVGRATIPEAVVSRFAGDSELILTRFRTEQHVFRSKPLILTRVAQREYRVTVLP